MNDKTDTPRTDALAAALIQRGRFPGGFQIETDNNGPIISMERHARTLERENAELRAALEECLTSDAANCYSVRAPKAFAEALVRRLHAINDTARAALAKVQQ